MKVLVIDDDVLLRRTVARMLTADGHDVVTAPDGERGMALCRREQPDLVITDVVMPNQEGLETILAIRREEIATKIIAISGADGEMLDLALLIGADEVLEKPFRAHELTDCVKRVVPQLASS